MQSNTSAPYHAATETAEDLDLLLSDETLFEVEVIDLDVDPIVKCLCRRS